MLATRCLLKWQRFCTPAMKRILRITLVSFLCLALLTQHPVVRSSASDQNSILNLYDAFGYQKRCTILDWGFSALVHYNGKTILFDTGNSADGFEHNVKALGVDLNQVTTKASLADAFAVALKRTRLAVVRSAESRDASPKSSSRADEA